MRKPKTFYVSRGDLTGQGASKTEAKADLDRQIEWALTNTAFTIESRFGLMIVIAASPNGYSHTIVNPAELEHGQQRHASCSYGQQCNYTTVLMSARSHAAQNAWHHDIADDAAFVAQAGVTAYDDDSKARDLASWISFQRKYRDAKNAGHDDRAAFDIAHGWKTAA